MNYFCHEEKYDLFHYSLHLFSTVKEVTAWTSLQSGFVHVSENV